MHLTDNPCSILFYAVLSAVVTVRETLKEVFHQAIRLRTGGLRRRVVLRLRYLPHPQTRTATRTATARTHAISNTTNMQLTATTTSTGMQVSETIITNNTSCNSLVRVCMALSRRVMLPVLNMKFSLSGINSGDWVHLAEVIFHEKHPSCLTNYNGSNEETGAPQNESSVATAVAVSCVLVVLLLIACVLAVVVVAWGCSKYRKHKVTHKTPPVIDLMA